MIVRYLHRCTTTGYIVQFGAVCDTIDVAPSISCPCCEERIPPTEFDDNRIWLSKVSDPEEWPHA